MSDIPKCPTCGRKASERYAPNPDFIDKVFWVCSDRFHLLGDWGPEMYEWLVAIRRGRYRWQVPRLDALLKAIAGEEEGGKR